MSLIDPISGNITDAVNNNNATNNTSAASDGQNAGNAFTEALTQAMTEQFTSQMNHQMTSLSMFNSSGSGSASGLGALGGISGMGMMPGMGMMDTTGIENALINAAESGEVGDAQIALFMMFMMMMMQSSSGDGTGLGQDMTPLMMAITQMISDRGGDAQALQTPNLHTNNPFQTAQSEPQGAALGAVQGAVQGSNEPHIRRMIEIGLSQVGYHERNRDGSIGSGNFTKFGDWFGMDGQPWCAMFVSWVANEAGLLGDVVPRHASTRVGANAYMEMGLYEPRSSGYQPREGDTIFFHNPSTGRINHVGLVVAFNPETNRVYTVEGNTNNQVRVLYHDLSSPSIHGFGRNGGTGFGTIPQNAETGRGGTIL
ncbi:MAG: CHAP domain-containing protein [Oscillospiraceae bacterium]|nr:CHAP domain-containing protein [Oscillospiraceae bacterium]